MKAVMLSIQQKWCELISSCKKTIEVRKTKPKIDVPFKCYIYCTQNTPYNPLIPMKYEKEGGNIYIGGKRYAEFLTSRVIGEFVCDEIHDFTKAFFDEQTERDTDEIAEFLGLTCLTYSELCHYVGLKDFYAWHISELVIYDKPKELSSFYVDGDCDCMNCRNCAWFDRGNGYNVEDDCNLAYKYVDEHKSYKPIKKPPKSWCYCEELKGEN